MFETVPTPPPAGQPPTAPRRRDDTPDQPSSPVTANGVRGPSVQTLTEWLVALGESSPAGDDAARIDRITALEHLKGAIAAAQARESVAFRHSQLDAQRLAGVPPDQLGRGIAAQIGLARRESPHRAGRMLTMATALVEEMPHTLTALSRGHISEWRASIVTTETGTLHDEQRRHIDKQLAPKLDSLSDRETYAATRRMAYAADPVTFVGRARKAAADRRVTIRPAPDTMSNVSALLPANQGVAVFAALKAAADAIMAAGDGRCRGQVMADTLVARVTGQESAPEVAAEVHLVITDHALLAGDSQPADLLGYGPVPAPLARQWLRDLSHQTRTWLRRIYTYPGTDQLQAVDSRRRLFSPGQRQTLTVRDGDTCRTPWCGAPIRHADHVLASGAGGPTSLANGQGLCSACNHAKQAPGWRHLPADTAEAAAAGARSPTGAGLSVSITTPTGHHYVSRPPPLPRGPEPRSPIEAQWTERMTAPRIRGTQIFTDHPGVFEYVAA